MLNDGKTLVDIEDYISRGNLGTSERVTREEIMRVCERGRKREKEKKKEEEEEDWSKQRLIGAVHEEDICSRDNNVE